MTPAYDSSLEVQLLLKEYDCRFQQTMRHLDRYAEQIKVSNLYLTAMTGGFLIIYSKQGGSLLSAADCWIYGVVLVLAASFLYYVASALMDEVFMLLICGARVRVLEELLNKKVGKEILTWESKIIPGIVNKPPWSHGFWVKPPLLMSLWCSIMGIAIIVLLASIWWAKVGTGFWFYLGFLIVSSVFQIIQFTQLLLVGSEKVNAVVKQSSELELEKPPIEKAPN